MSGRGVRAACLMVVGMLATACATSAPTRVYVLGSTTPTETAKGAPCIVLGIGPVEIPGYLDRPQIVTRLSSNEIQPSDFDQWGEPLAQGIGRALADNLASQLCAQRVEYYPWKGSLTVDYQVRVRVTRFEGHLGGSAELVAQWTLVGSDGKKVLAEKSSSLSAPAVGSGYEGLVAAQSKTLEKLSVEIASEIKAVSK